jgi:hypothetical protein
MTVWTKQREILGAIVAPIAVDVLHFHWNSPGSWIALIPTAARASFSEAFDEVLPQKTAVDV